MIVAQLFRLSCINRLSQNTFSLYCDTFTQDVLHTPYLSSQTKTTQTKRLNASSLLSYNINIGKYIRFD